MLMGLSTGSLRADACSLDALVILVTTEVVAVAIIKRCSYG